MSLSWCGSPYKSLVQWAGKAYHSTLQILIPKSDCVPTRIGKWAGNLATCNIYTNFHNGLVAVPLCDKIHSVFLRKEAHEVVPGPELLKPF